MQLCFPRSLPSVLHNWLPSYMSRSRTRHSSPAVAQSKDDVRLQQQYAAYMSDLTTQSDNAPKPAIREILALTFGLAGVTAGLVALRLFQVLAIVLFIAGCAPLAVLGFWPWRSWRGPRTVFVLLLSLVLFGGAAWFTFGLNVWSAPSIAGPYYPPGMPVSPSTYRSIGSPSPSIASTGVPTTGTSSTGPVTSPAVPPTVSSLKIDPATCTDVLPGPWRLQAAQGEAKQEYDFPNRTILQDKTVAQLTYDLHGLSVNEGPRKDESAIVFFRPPQWYVISLANHGNNGTDGKQTVVVPLSDFIGLPDEPSHTAGGNHLDLTQPVNGVIARFWRPAAFTVEVFSIRACRTL